MKQAFALLTVLLAAGVPTPRRPGNFVVVGPGGGGAMFHPTISPHDPRTVLLNCDMTGGYVSHNAGESWRMFNLRSTLGFFVFDPKSPSTFYTRGSGLWRSTDAGVTWKLVWPRPSTITGVEMNSDHADEALVSSDDPVGNIDAMAIDPRDPNTFIAAATKDRSSSAVWVSKNAGESWSREAPLSESAQRVYLDPRHPEEVYVAGAHGVDVRSNGEWKRRPGPSGVAFTMLSAGFPETGAPVFYGVSTAGAYVSRDGGAEWQAVQLPGTGTVVQAVATSLRHPETAYLSYRDMKLEDGKQWIGVARSRDSGASWTLVWKESDKGGPNIHDAWITPALGPDWGSNPLDLGVADQDAKLVYATDFGRTLRSTDGGDTWGAVYSKQLPGAAWTTRGLDVTTAYGYHVDPFDSRKRFITYTDIGLSRSDDGGRTWTRSMTGVPQSWDNTAYWLAFDPEVKGRVWGVMSGTHDLPRPKMWRRTSVLSYKGGVCRSDDGAVTWNCSSKGMPQTAPTHVVLDPSSPPDRRVLYVAAMGRGVYKSEDGGATWALRNDGITQQDPLAWRLALAKDGTLYLVVARRSEHGEIGDERDGALYRSRDGAAHWEPMTLPAGVNGPNGLTLDATDPNRLYLAAWARAVGTHGAGGGVYLSSDAGATWTQVLELDQHVYDVTVDPRDEKTLYACGFESSAWRSTDRGEHWTRISGFNFKWGHRVMPDPDDAAKVFITTFGGSVWHGRTDAPPRLLDIATPELDPGR